MHPVLPQCKARQGQKPEGCHREEKKDASVLIPASWGLNALQREFIHLMSEDYKSQK